MTCCEKCCPRETMSPELTVSRLVAQMRAAVMVGDLVATPDWVHPNKPDGTYKLTEHDIHRALNRAKKRGMTVLQMRQVMSAADQLKVEIWETIDMLDGLYPKKFMRLDYRPKTRNFILWVEHGEADVNKLVREHGLDYSLPASTPQTAALYTAEPFAACAFGRWATDAALDILAPTLREIDASWALEPTRPRIEWPGHLCPDDCEPYGLQLADLEYVFRRQHSLVADEPGVGKTPTAIMYANLLAHASSRPERFRALAIVPASIRLQWAARIRQWSTIPNTQISVVSTSSRGIPPTSGSIHWTILSYDACRSPALYKALIVNNYDLLVLDEAHYLKSPSASRTRKIFGAEDLGTSIGERAEHILALTGTPIPNRPREAYTLAKNLCFEAVDFSSERAFNERFNPRSSKR